MACYRRYVFDITHCHGVTDDAMACMLSSWVRETADSQEWLGREALHALKTGFALRNDDIERMSIAVLNSLDGTGLYAEILNNPGVLNEVTCKVNRDIALLELEWV